MPYQVIYEDAEGHITSTNVAGRRAVDALLCRLREDGNTILTVLREDPFGPFVAA
jgi:hypothetical protein